MRYIAIYSKGAIMTDDYDMQEILQKRHIEHIKADIRYWHIKGAVTVYDENMRYICKLNKRKVA